MEHRHNTAVDNVAAAAAESKNVENVEQRPRKQNVTLSKDDMSDTATSDVVANGKQEPQLLMEEESTKAIESIIAGKNGTTISETFNPIADGLSDSSVLPVQRNMVNNDADRNDDIITKHADIAENSAITGTPQHMASDPNGVNGVLSDKQTIGEISLSTIAPVNHKELVVTDSIPLQEQKVCMVDSNNDIVAALQENLQNQMIAKAEAEDKVRKLEYNVRLLEDQIQKQADGMLKLDTIQENLQLQMNAKAEAEHKARSAFDRVQQLEAEKEKCTQDLTETQQQLSETRQMMVDKDRELDKVRNERDTYERKVTALTTRLNAAKKLEAVKVNHVDEIEDDLKITSDELQHVTLVLEQNISAKRHLEQQLKCVETVSKEQIELLESSLAEEKRLNEERKLKMKEYVEKKTEELRQAKEENDSLQMELAQTNRSLVELNTRWKQIHTQWVQAQTRNRELQRDLQRTKKDSEHLHKQGDTLEMKLSRSANETEEHKSKRLAAKQELMSVLRALELERDVTTKLRDQIKFTFVPKILNQQQTLHEIIQELTTTLEKLSLRLGKPLLSLPEESEHDEVNNATNANGTHNDNAFSQSDIHPLIEKLDYESQKVSSGITAVLNNVERLRALVQASGDRTCFTVLSELVHTGGMESSPAIQADRARNQLQAAIGRSHRYGQIPGTSD